MTSTQIESASGAGADRESAEADGLWVMTNEMTRAPAIQVRACRDALFRGRSTSPLRGTARPQAPLTTRVTHADAVLAMPERPSGRLWGYVPPNTPCASGRSPYSAGDARIRCSAQHRGPPCRHGR